MGGGNGYSKILQYWVTFCKGRELGKNIIRIFLTTINDVKAALMRNKNK